MIYDDVTAHSEIKVLSTALGRDSFDAFYLVCAFNSLKSIKDFVSEGRSQNQLDAGLRAAYSTGRPDVAKYLVDQGADVRPLVAFIGPEKAQGYLHKGTQMLALALTDSTFIEIVPSWSSERVYHDLRLQWVSLRPSNLTVRTAVEGSSPPRPSILHLQALNTSTPSAQRMAWMKFDLARTAKANINRHASVVNVEGTPLHWAVDDHGEAWRNREVLEFLLDQGADPRIENRVGQTPLAFVREMLERPDGDLSSECREFYRFASHILAQAERSVARSPGGPVSIDVWARLKNVIVLWR